MPSPVVVNVTHEIAHGFVRAVVTEGEIASFAVLSGAVERVEDMDALAFSLGVVRDKCAEVINGKA